METTAALQQAVAALGRTRLRIRPFEDSFFGEGVIAGHSCLCVHDTPENPCPCPPWPIVMIPRDSILAKGESRRQSQEGEHLAWVEVDSSAQLRVLTATTMPAGLYDKMTRGAGPGATAFRPSRLDAWIKYMADYWNWVLYEAWGPLPSEPPEPPD